MRNALSRVFAVVLAASTAFAVPAIGAPLYRASPAPAASGSSDIIQVDAGAMVGPGRSYYSPRRGWGNGRYYRSDRRYYRGHHRHYRHYRHHHRRGGDWVGPAIGGFVTGAIVGGAIANSNRGGSAHENWCYNRYRSYRAWDNTFQPYNGPRRQCISPY